MTVLLPIKETGTLPPMFIVHGRFGQAFVSPHFLKLLGHDQPVWAFQARGLDGAHEPHATIEAMAEDYLSEMRKLRPHGPYFLAALCAGALIANVMARTLRAAGEVVLPLLLFDPPQHRMRASVAEADLLTRIRARRSQFVKPIDDPEYATASVRTARAFEMAIWDHEPTPYDGAIYMLSSRQRMAQPSTRFMNKLFTGKVERVEVGATHADSLDPRNPVFAENLRRYLTRIAEEARQADRAMSPASTA